MIQQLDEPAVQKRKEVMENVALGPFLVVVGDMMLTEEVRPRAAGEAVTADTTEPVLAQNRSDSRRGLDRTEWRAPLGNAADDGVVAFPPCDCEAETVPTAPARWVHEGVVGAAWLIQQDRAALHRGRLDPFWADIGLQVRTELASVLGCERHRVLLALSIQEFTVCSGIHGEGGGFP